jgi:hypothetical protein
VPVTPGQGRLAGPAVGLGIRAAGREPAAGRKAGQVGRHAADAREPLAGIVVESGYRLQQRLGVGVTGLTEQVSRARGLGNLARVHHHDPVGPARDHAHVMGDQNDRHPQPLAQAVQQVENLSLNRHVQRGRGLVRDQQLRVAGQRHGDDNALAQAARELVRVVVDPLRGPRHPDQAKHLERARPRLRGRRLAVQPHRFADLLADGHRRVQRGHRILVDHRDLVAPDILHLPAVQRDQVGAAEQDAARGDAPGSGQQPHDGQPGGALAAARLADQTDAFAVADGEAHAVDRGHRPASEPELGPQLLDLQERLLARLHAAPSPARNRRRELVAHIRHMYPRLLPRTTTSSRFSAARAAYVVTSAIVTVTQYKSMTLRSELDMQWQKVFFRRVPSGGPGPSGRR